MHVGWTRGEGPVLPGLDAGGDGPTNVRGTVMLDYDEVQLVGDGELITNSPYLSYDPNNTRVLRYVLYYGSEEVFRAEHPNGLKPGWRSAQNARTARAEVLREHPRILEENAAGDHVFFRVDK